MMDRMLIADDIRRLFEVGKDRILLSEVDNVALGLVQDVDGALYESWHIGCMLAEEYGYTYQDHPVEVFVKNP